MPKVQDPKPPPKPPKKRKEKVDDPKPLIPEIKLQEKPLDPK